MSPFNLQTIGSTNFAGNSASDQARQDFAKTPHAFVLSVMGSIFILIAIFVFAAACILFLIRFGVLVILMVLSPLAYAGMILPKTHEYAKKWWNTLLTESFFAPLFMAMIWFVLTIVNSPGYKNSLGIGTNSFALAIDNPTDPGALSVVLNFGIVITFLVASLIISKQLGAYGGDRALKAFNGLRTRAQGIVGRAAVRGTGVNWINKQFEKDGRLARFGDT